MTTFFTADLHLGHERIIEKCYRPFLDLGQMHYKLAQNWNSVVGPDDDVIVLGDVAFGPINRHRELIESLNGTKFLVAGNHDSCWSGHRRKTRARNKRQEYLDAGFFYVYDDITRFELPGVGEVILSHLPTDGDTQEEERYDEMRPIDDGTPVICGHVHGEWLHRGVNVNVGVDWHGYTPIEASEVANLVSMAFSARMAASRA